MALRFSRFLQHFQLARVGDTSGLKAMIKEGKVEDIDATEEGSFGSDTALHFACANNHLSTVQVLVKAGADVNAWGERGYSPLHFYAR